MRRQLELCNVSQNVQGHRINFRLVKPMIDGYVVVLIKVTECLTGPILISNQPCKLSIRVVRAHDEEPRQCAMALR